MMQNDYAKEALETTAIVYKNGSPHMMRLDYPPGTWESMVRAAHLSKDVECFFVMDGTPEAEKLLAERDAILERNAEPEEIVFVQESLTATEAELEEQRELNAELTKRLNAQQQQINELLTRGRLQDTPPLAGRAPASDTPTILTEENLKGLPIHELRSLAVSYSTPGSGTAEDLISRIRKQQEAGVVPK